MKDTRPSGQISRCMFAIPFAIPAGFHTDHPNLRIIEEFMEKPHRVRTAADARYKIVGKPPFFLFYLFSGFYAYDRLEVPVRESITSLHESVAFGCTDS